MRFAATLTAAAVLALLLAAAPLPAAKPASDAKAKEPEKPAAAAAEEYEIFTVNGPVPSNAVVVPAALWPAPLSSQKENTAFEPMRGALCC